MKTLIVAAPPPMNGSCPITDEEGRRVGHVRVVVRSSGQSTITVCDAGGWTISFGPAMEWRDDEFRRAVLAKRVEDAFPGYKVVLRKREAEDELAPSW